MTHRSRLLLAACALSTLSLAFLIPQEKAENQEHRERERIEKQQEFKRSHTVHAQPQTESETPAELAAYRQGEVLVGSADLAAVASDYGVAVLRPAGPAGYGTISVPEGISELTFSALLQEDERVNRAFRNGVVLGASDEDDALEGNGTLTSTTQWHINELGSGWSGDVVIAVLDTGAAYKNDAIRGTKFAETDALKDVPIKDPYDFVNDTDKPYDDHQHGTHLASLIMGMHSDSAGIARGAELMPIKVLDENKMGTEQTLLDGLAWAIDREAEVINLSLVFPSGYVPSAALLELIEEAWDEGIVIVAAAGNDGAGDVAWPAKHRLVIAVGASTMDTEAPYAAYSNRGPATDVVIYGGDLTQDLDGDGYADGLVAETIGYQDSNSTGLWSMAGTSQATALATGLVAHMLADGVDHTCIANELRAMGDNSAFVLAAMTGTTETTGKLTLGEKTTSGSCDTYERYAAATAGFLYEHENGDVTPAVLVTVLDEGVPAQGVWAVGAFWGETGMQSWCQTDTDGMCLLTGETIADPGTGLAWSYQVDAVLDASLNVYRPGVAVFATDALDSTLETLAADASLSEAAIGVYYTGDVLVGGYQPQAESWTISNIGTGISTSPFGVIGDPISIGDLDGPTSTRTLGLSYATDWWGTTTSSTDAYTSGNGISTSPFGLIPDLPGIGRPAPGTFAPLMLSEDDPVSSSTASGIYVDGTATGTWLDGGGSTWTGEQAGWTVGGASHLSIEADVLTVGTGAGAEAR
jgi:hypothetical protein